MFLEISQNSQENTCASGLQLFSCEFCEISKKTFLQNTSGQVLLYNNAFAPYVYFYFLKYFVSISDIFIIALRSAQVT